MTNGFEPHLIFTRLKFFMKKLLVSVAVIIAFTGVNNILAQEKAKWKEMDAFHEIMAKTFHPAEEGKLEPIRNRSQEMLNKATIWQNSTAPEGYNQKAIKKSLKELVKGAKEINNLVRANASDDVLKTKLSKLHNVFHEIMEKCENENHM